MKRVKRSKSELLLSSANFFLECMIKAEQQQNGNFVLKKSPLISIIKSWKGCHIAANMENPGYLEEWKKSAVEAEAQKKVLTVFSIPASITGFPDGDIITAIQKLIAEKEASIGTGPTG